MAADEKINNSDWQVLLAMVCLNMYSCSFSGTESFTLLMLTNWTRLCQKYVDTYWMISLLLLLNIKFKNSLILV